MGNGAAPAPAALVVSQVKIVKWPTQTDPATGLAIAFDNSQPADAQLAIARTPQTVGGSYSPNAMTRNLWLSEAEMKALYAQLGALITALQAQGE